MNNSIKEELTDYIKEAIQEQLEYNEDYLSSDDIHQDLFNTDVYVTYYTEADKWLIEHDIDAFEAISVVQEYEIDNFGETRVPLNSEAIVNMLAYIYGLELVEGIVEDMQKLKDTKKAAYEITLYGATFSTDNQENQRTYETLVEELETYKYKKDEMARLADNLDTAICYIEENVADDVFDSNDFEDNLSKIYKIITQMQGTQR